MIKFLINWAAGTKCGELHYCGLSEPRELELAMNPGAVARTIMVACNRIKGHWGNCRKEWFDR